MGLIRKPPDYRPRERAKGPKAHQARYTILSPVADEAVVLLAEREHRTISSMIRLLVEEALTTPGRMRQLGLEQPDDSPPVPNVNLA